MAVYYKGNELDTTSKEKLANELIWKVTRQMMEDKTFESKFSIFDKGDLEAGAQIEEVENGNITSTAFDPTGAGALTKKDLKLKAIYHKKNREQTYKTTVSNKQIRKGMLSEAGIARIASKIVNEVYNSAAIEDYEAMGQLFTDIVKDSKNMVVCDLNDNNKVDDFIKAVKVIARNMTFPSVNYNYLGFKKEFSKYEDLVLIIDTSMEAVIDVDSLAGAFHMDKKSLVNNVIVVDKMPDITYTGEKCTEALQIPIGSSKPLLIDKLSSGGMKTVSGKVKAFLVSKNAIIHCYDRYMEEPMRNGDGAFTNYFLQAEDILSYSPLRNAVVFVD